MSKLYISGKFKWVLVLGITFLLLTSFIACSDGPNGPIIIEEEDDEDEDKPHDVLLQETARILYDLIVIPDATAAELQALKIEQPRAINNM